MVPLDLQLLIPHVCYQALLLQPPTSAASRASPPQLAQTAGASWPSVKKAPLVHHRPTSSTAPPAMLGARRTLQWLPASPHGKTIQLFFFFSGMAPRQPAASPRASCGHTASVHLHLCHQRRSSYPHQPLGWLNAEDGSVGHQHPSASQLTALSRSILTNPAHESSGK